MRCYGAVHDDLHDYAAEVLERMTEHLQAKPVAVRSFGSFDCTVVHRQGNLQTELVMIDPGTVIPLHAHPNADSVDLLVRGNVSSFEVSGQKLARFVLGMGLRIPAGEPHGGSAQADDIGVWFLSCQRWRIPPNHIALDWEGAPVTYAHERVLEMFRRVR